MNFAKQSKIRENEEKEYLKFLSNGVESFAESTNSSTGIKCFWLEPETMTVFDIKGLKRPIRQK